MLVYDTMIGKMSITIVVCRLQMIKFVGNFQLLVRGRGPAEWQSIAANGTYRLVRGRLM